MSKRSMDECGKTREVRPRESRLQRQGTRQILDNPIVVGTMVRAVYRRYGWEHALAFVCCLGAVSRNIHMLAWSAYRAVLRGRSGCEEGREALLLRIYSTVYAESAFRVYALAFHGSDEGGALLTAAVRNENAAHDIRERHPHIVLAPPFIRIIADYADYNNDETLELIRDVINSGSVHEMRPLGRIGVVAELLGVGPDVAKAARAINEKLAVVERERGLPWLFERCRPIWTLLRNPERAAQAANAAVHTLDILRAHGIRFVPFLAEMAAAHVPLGLGPTGESGDLTRLGTALEVAKRAGARLLSRPSEQRASLALVAATREGAAPFLGRFAGIFGNADGPRMWRTALKDSNWQAIAEALAEAGIRPDAPASFKASMQTNSIHEARYEASIECINRARAKRRAIRFNRERD
jgi:hypothetical protein